MKVHVKEGKVNPRPSKRANPHGCKGAGGVDYGNGKAPVSRFLTPRQGTAASTEQFGDMKVLKWKDGLYTDRRGRPLIRNSDERKRWEEASGQRYEG